MEKLFAEFDRQMEGRRLILKQSTMMDATLVETRHRRPPPQTFETFSASTTP